MSRLVLLILGGLISLLRSDVTVAQPEKFQFMPWKWVTLLGPGERGEEVVKGRYGIGTYLLLQDSQKMNKEHIITEVLDEGDRRLVSVYVTPTLDIDDQPLVRARCLTDEVVTESAVVDTVYKRLASFRPSDARLNAYGNGEVYYLHQEGKEIAVYEKSLTYKGYHPAQTIMVVGNGDILRFYAGRTPMVKDDSGWVIQITKVGTTSKESLEGTQMEVPVVRIETHGGDLEGLSAESFIIGTVLRYGRRSFLETHNRVTEATVDSAGNPTYVEQVTLGGVAKVGYSLGNFQVNLLAGG